MILWSKPRVILAWNHFTLLPAHPELCLLHAVALMLFLCLFLWLWLGLSFAVFAQYVAQWGPDTYMEPLGGTVILIMMVLSSQDILAVLSFRQCHFFTHFTDWSYSSVILSFFSYPLNLILLLLFHPSLGSCQFALFHQNCLIVRIFNHKYSLSFHLPTYSFTKQFKQLAETLLLQPSFSFPFSLMPTENLIYKDGQGTGEYTHKRS